MNVCPECGICMPHEAHQEQPPGWCRVALAAAWHRYLRDLPETTEGE